MNTKIKAFGLVALMMMGMSAKAQNSETEFIPHGQPVVTLFEHVGIGYNPDQKVWNHKGFELERAYFGYKYFFSPEWQATVIFDASEGNGNGIEHAFVKNAFVRYNSNNLQITAGMIPTEQGLKAEGCWGYRYVAKAFYDMNGWGASADLGMQVKYRFTPWMSIDAMMLNGEGFKNVQMDNHFLYTVGLDVTPIENLDIRLYADNKTCDSDTGRASQQNISLFAGYNHQYFRIGAEYNIQLNNSNVKDHNMSGFSAFATYKASPKINVFARYDYGTSETLIENDTWNYKNDGEMMMLGMEWKINKLISLAPAIQLRGKTLNEGNWYGYVSAKVAL